MASYKLKQLHKSRNILLDQLQTQGYTVSGYQNFSIHEIDAMMENHQLDMKAQRESDGSVVYVKYIIDGKPLRPQTLDDLVEDLFDVEMILTDKQKDAIVLVTQDEPNESILSKLKYLFDKDGYFICVRTMDRLQFNVLNHVLVPEAVILTEMETAELMKTLNLNNLRKLPEISRFDPQALALGVRPGKVMKFYRNSPTSLVAPYWRICV
jgi:DNA-directed RNA polymerase subunit H